MGEIRVPSCKKVSLQTGKFKMATIANEVTPATVMFRSPMRRLLQQWRSGRQRVGSGDSDVPVANKRLLRQWRSSCQRAGSCNSDVPVANENFPSGKAENYWSQWISGKGPIGLKNTLLWGGAVAPCFITLVVLMHILHLDLCSLSKSNRLLTIILTITLGLLHVSFTWWTPVTITLKNEDSRDVTAALHTCTFTVYHSVLLSVASGLTGSRKVRSGEWVVLLWRTSKHLAGNNHYILLNSFIKI